MLTENKRQTVPRREKLFRAKTFGSTLSARSQIFSVEHVVDPLEIAFFLLLIIADLAANKLQKFFILIKLANSTITQPVIGNA